MAAEIHRFSSTRERLNRTQAEELKQAVMPFINDHDPVVVRMVGELVDHIEWNTRSSKRWPFLMISPVQNNIVRSRIKAEAKRPRVTEDVWFLLFEHVHPKTCEVLLRREEIAEKLGIAAAQVSTCMSDLVKIGAISRRRDRAEGVQGPGYVRYFMNANVATHAKGDARTTLQAEFPILKVIDGSSHPSQRRSRAAFPSVAVL